MIFAARGGRAKVARSDRSKRRLRNRCPGGVRDVAWTIYDALASIEPRMMTPMDGHRISPKRAGSEIYAEATDRCAALLGRSAWQRKRARLRKSRSPVAVVAGETQTSCCAMKLRKSRNPQQPASAQREGKEGSVPPNGLEASRWAIKNSSRVDWPADCPAKTIALEVSRPRQSIGRAGLPSPRRTRRSARKEPICFREGSVGHG